MNNIEQYNSVMSNISRQLKPLVEKLDYDKIISIVAKNVKSYLNEQTFNIMGYQVNSLQQQKMSDIKDLDKALPFKEQQFAKQIQQIFTKMHTDPRFAQFLKQNPMNQNIQWSHMIDTACTDGHNGQLIMNPEYIQTIFNNTGELGVQFIILHETMHNYYNNTKHAREIVTVTDNILIDKQINHEIITKWPIFKPIAEKLNIIL